MSSLHQDIKTFTVWIGTSFLATEQPFQNVRKENRREVGASLFDLSVFWVATSANVEYVSSM